MSKELDLVATKIFWTRIYETEFVPRTLTPLKLQTVVPVFWSQMSDCVVLAVSFETPVLSSD